MKTLTDIKQQQRLEKRDGEFLAGNPRVAIALLRQSRRKLLTVCIMFGSICIINNYFNDVFGDQESRKSFNLFFCSTPCYILFIHYSELLTYIYLKHNFFYGLCLHTHGEGFWALQKAS